MARPLKIFISSPGDVADERRRAALVISLLKREFARFLDISAVLWEYEPMLSSGHFQDSLDQHLRELLRRRLPPQPLRIAGPKECDRIEWWSGSPYRGLQAFDMEHAVVFFGRERAEREISEALVRHAGQGKGFMLVVGASG